MTNARSVVSVRPAPGGRRGRGMVDGRRLRCGRRCLGQAVVVGVMGHRWGKDGVIEDDGRISKP